MTQAQGTDIGRTGRWLLLFCTLFGLAMMHTVGHLGMPMDAHSHTAAQAEAHTAALDEVHAAAQAETPGLVITGLWPAHLMHKAVPALCPDGHCDDTPAHGGMSAWELCLAVLGGITLVLLLGGVLQRHSPAHTGREREGVGERRVGRGPPHRRAALTVASTAVLRI